METQWLTRQQGEGKKGTLWGSHLMRPSLLTPTFGCSQRRNWNASIRTPGLGLSKNHPLLNPDSQRRRLEPQICTGSALCWPPWVVRLCSAVLGGAAPAGGGTGDSLHLRFTPAPTHHLRLLPFQYPDPPWHQGLWWAIVSIPLPLGQRTRNSFLKLTCPSFHSLSQKNFPTSGPKPSSPPPA